MKDIVIPSGWAVATIDQVSIKVEQRKPEEDEELVYIDISSIDRVEKKIRSPQIILGRDAPSRARKVISGGDILVSLTRPNLNAVALVDEKYHGQFASTGFEVIRPALIDPRYLYQITRSKCFIDSISGKVQGALYPAAKSSDVKAYCFPLPPLREQVRIANKLDELLAQVETIKARVDAIPVILKRFRQSVLAAAVTGKLTEGWRGSGEYLDNQGLKVPSEWKVLKAKDACSKVQSGSTPKNKPFDQGGTVPFLKVYNIVDQKIDFDYKPQFILDEVHAKNLARSVAYPGDVLMNIVGPPLGKVAVLTDQFPEWNLNQAITLFRANGEILKGKFLYYVLCEGQLVRAVMPETRGQVGQINISLSQCRESVLPIPSIEEQEEILQSVEGFLAFAEQVDQCVKDAQDRIEKLTQSILAKAFRGELVPQDPTDEPASELLARIQREREAALRFKNSTKKMVNRSNRNKEKKVAGSASSTKINKKNVKDWLKKINEEMFDYQDLEKDFIGSKSAIEKIIFSLMEEPDPLIRQVFDSGTGKILFKKTS